MEKKSYNPLLSRMGQMHIELVYMCKFFGPDGRMPNQEMYDTIMISKVKMKALRKLITKQITNNHEHQ